MQLLINAPLLKGNVCELGCWRGLSSVQMATYLKKSGFKNNFYIFDSFEGLSKFKDVDKVDLNKNYEEESLSFSWDFDKVKQVLKEFDFIVFEKGWIPEKFHTVSEMKFSFVHIDVDLYEPTKDSLHFFYPRLCQNGIIVLDDYGCPSFPGAKKAVDEYLEKKSDHFFIELPSGSAFILKR